MAIIRDINWHEAYCVSCRTVPCACKRPCPKCGSYSGCRCYFTPEEINYYRDLPDSPVFPTKYTGGCRRCGGWMLAGEPAQYIYNGFGHPLGECDPRNRLAREVEKVNVSIAIEKEKSMSRREIETEIRAHEKMLSELRTTRALMQGFGKDADYPNQTVLFFERTFSDPTVSYDYVAVKIRPNTWYLTGKWSVAMSFEDLLTKHLIKSEKVWIVTAWKELEV